MLPIKKKQISVYGRRMLNDNSKAILDFLINNQYNLKYKIRLIIDPKVYHEEYKDKYNVNIITGSTKSLWTLFRSNYIFHSHGMTKCSFIPSKRQIIFNLWHGSPLKNIGIRGGSYWVPQTDSYFLCASPFMAQINKRCFLLKDKQVFLGSNPRNDLMFHKTTNPFIQELKEDKKLILFMPTFRRSNELQRTDSSCDIPILNSTNIIDVDTLLKNENVLLVIKPHPYQEQITFLHDLKLSNIKILYNKDLEKHKLSLYELLGHSDALISDYSSVFFDYLLLNKPIGFAIDDINSYSENRGYTVNNPLELMPGPKMTNIDDLIHFVHDVVSENDEYLEERRKVNSLCNSFVSPDGCKRILDFLNITNE